MNLEMLRAAMAQNKTKPTLSDIPGLGKVYLRNLTIAEAEEFNENKPDDGTQNNIYARNLLRMMCDAQGNRLAYSEADVVAMSEQPLKTLSDIQAAIDQAIGTGNLGAEAAKKG